MPIRNESNNEPIDAWNWVIDQNSKYLRSNILLEKGFNHGFFTKQSSQQTAEELIKKQNPVLSFHLLNQIDAHTKLG